MLPILADTPALAKKLAEAQDACDAILGRMRRYIEENAQKVQDQAQYEACFREMNDEYEEAKKQVEDINGCKWVQGPTRFNAASLGLVQK